MTARVPAQRARTLPAPARQAAVPATGRVAGPPVRLPGVRAGIWRADIQHLPHAVDLIARDLAASPLGGWLIPDDAVRQPRLRGVVQILLLHAFRHGQIDIADHGAGIAVWYTRPAAGVPEIPAVASRLAQAAGRCHGRIAAVLHTRQQLLPSGRAVDHLAFLAIRPDSRGRGVAGRLLAHRHRLLDLLDRPAYADTVDPGTRQLLIRYGYRPSTPALIRPSGFTLWPLHRPAHAPRTVSEGQQ